MEKERYDGLNGLRTYAILGIVIMHVKANIGYTIDGWIYNSFISAFTDFVFLFMMVSAFGMCCGYYEKIRNGNISLDKFYSKRYAKVWPFFACLCLLDLTISPSMNSLYEVFANLTLCFGLLPNAHISVIGVGWTLGVIFVFYLMFPFFCYLIGNKKRAWFSFVVALLFNIIASYYFNVDRTNIIYSGVYFIAGGLVYLYREPLKYFVNKFKFLAWVIVIICSVIYFLTGTNVGVTLLVSAALLIYSLGSSKIGFINNKFTKFISGISFEIYLSHMVLYRVIEKLNLINVFNNNILSYIIVCLVTIILTIIFSIAMRKLFDKIDELICKNKKSSQES